MSVTIFDPTPCALGEGPLFAHGRLFWFDILNRRLHARAPGAAEAATWSFDEMFSAAGILPDGELLLASETGLWRFSPETGARERIVAIEADTPVTRSNDGRADRQGGFWIGTMGKGAETGAGSIWRFHKGDLRRLVENVTVSNAICFAPDGTRGYYADTGTQKIMTWPLDADGWPAADATPFFDFAALSAFPDGAVTDSRRRPLGRPLGQRQGRAHPPRRRPRHRNRAPRPPTHLPGLRRRPHDPLPHLRPPGPRRSRPDRTPRLRQRVRDHDPDPRPPRADRDPRHLTRPPSSGLIRPGNLSGSPGAHANRHGKTKQPANGPSFVPRRRRGTPPLPRALANARPVRQAGQTRRRPETLITQPHIDTSPPVSDEIRKTTCYMCACRCGIDVHLTDGRVSYIEGNRDHPVNRGVLCAKGSAGIMQHVSPARLRAPLRRTGPRGSGEFEEITWDEALDLAASWLAPDPRDRAREARLLHRPRPVAELHRLVGAAIRHAELRRPWRLLLGQHGGGRHLHDGRRVLGIRRARLGAHQALHDLRRRRGPRQQPDQDRPRQAQGARRQDHRRQPGPHRLQRHRRRMARR